MSAFFEAAAQLVRRVNLLDLRWRHHGLGMYQAELTETLRIHVWHPHLVSPAMAWPRCVHDHRFDIESAVVVGEVIDWPHLRAFGYGAASDTENVDVYEIEHAKEQDRLIDEASGKTQATYARLYAKGSVLRGTKVVIPAGRSYRIRRREFHTTLVEELAVTVVHRSNFDTALARVMCGPGGLVEATSGIVRDDTVAARTLRLAILDEARQQILRVYGPP